MAVTPAAENGTSLRLIPAVISGLPTFHGKYEGELEPSGTERAESEVDLSKSCDSIGVQFLQTPQIPHFRITL